MKGCKKMGGTAIRHKNEYEIYFHTYLAKFIKEWSDSTGASAFVSLFENLKAANINFNVEITDYTNISQAGQDENKSIESVEAKAQEIISFAGQIEPNMWKDKEMASQVYKQVTGLYKIMEREIQRSEQNPDMDLTKLLDLNMKLSALREHISKAAKGDMSSAMKIPQLCNSKGNRTLVTNYRK